MKQQQIDPNKASRTHTFSLESLVHGRMTADIEHSRCNGQHIY